MEEPWPGSISLQGSEDADISPGGLQGEKPDHLAQCCWVPGGDGSFSGMAAFMGYWGQTSRRFSVVFLSLGKLEVEMPPEEHAPGMSITGSVL